MRRVWLSLATVVLIVPASVAFVGDSATTPSPSPSPTSTPPAESWADEDPDPEVARTQKPVDPEAWMSRPDDDLRQSSRHEFARTGAAESKMRANEAGLYRSTQSSAGPLLIKVYVDGEETTHQTAGDEKVPNGITIHGWRATEKELNRLSAHGEIMFVGKDDGSIWLQIDSKPRIDAIANLDFVYSIQMPKPQIASDASIEYGLSWKQEQEKITWLWGHRDQDDGAGNGRMPETVWTAIIDTGYDRDETRFFLQPNGEAYAESQIDHCHTWVGATLVTWTRSYAGEPLDSACGDSEDNSHGTGVADILDGQNKGGGTLHVYNMQGAPLEWAYQHIKDFHSSMDVISSSLGVFVPGSGDTVCQGFFDQLLEYLIGAPRMLLSGTGANPSTSPNFVYPLETTYFATTGGVLNGTPWQKPINNVARNVQLDPLLCPIQRDFHAARDGATQIWKPDVYGSYLHYVDVPGGHCADPDGDPNTPDAHPQIICGNSWAQPDTASGLGSIHSRFYLGKTLYLAGMKDWDPSSQCWEGAIRLVWFSNSPDGRGITPWDAQNEKGRLQDHDAWYLDSWDCP